MYRNIRDNATGTRMLTTKAAEIEVSGDFILNPNHVFYYRVNYDRALLNFFKETLLNDHEALSVQDRSGLISDTFSMVSSNLTAVENAMDMTKYLRVIFNLILTYTYIRLTLISKFNISPEIAETKNGTKPIKTRTF